MFSLGLHRPWIIGVHRHRRGAAARAVSGTVPRRGPAGGGEARDRAVIGTGNGERRMGNRARAVTAQGTENGARAVTAERTGNGERGSCRHSRRNGEQGTGTGARAVTAPGTGNRERAQPHSASRGIAADGADVTALICIHLPLRPAAANQRAPLTCCGRTRARPGAGPRPPGGAAAVRGGRGGAMACGGFACSKNCLCALNLLYTVRARRARPARGRGLCLVPPLPAGLGCAGVGRWRGSLRFSRRDAAAGVGGPRCGRWAVAASGSGGWGGRGEGVTAVRPGFVTARTWLLEIKIQGGPGAAAAGSSPGTSSLGAWPAGALFLRVERALHQSRREGRKGLFCYSSAKDQCPNKCSSVGDEAPSSPGVPRHGPGSY